MIQRIQSLYLFFCFLLSAGLTSIVSIWSTIKLDIYILDFLKSTTIIQKTIPVLFFLSALLSVISIFRFKNRKSQFILGRINILINLLLLGVLIYLSQTLSGEAMVSEKGIGMFIPILVVLFLVFANRAIKKDEDLVKSVDRLR